MLSSVIETVLGSPYLIVVMILLVKFYFIDVAIVYLPLEVRKLSLAEDDNYSVVLQKKQVA